MIKNKFFSMKNLSISFVLIIVCLVLVSCDSNNSGVPNVEGVYQGLMTFEGLGTTDDVNTTWNVIQHGDQVTITGTQDGESTPALTGTVNETGFLTITAGGGARSWQHSLCGQIRVTSSTAVFSAQNVQVQEEAVSSNCGSFSLSGVLVRSRS